MSEPEVIWHAEKSRNFLADLQAFCRSLDHYEISIDLRDDASTQVELTPEGYRLHPSSGPGRFTCPECGARTFEVVEGSLDGRSVLGLACRQCETYGLLFPQGL